MGCDEVQVIHRNAIDIWPNSYSIEWDLALDNSRTVGLDGDNGVAVVPIPEDGQDTVEVEVSLADGKPVLIEMHGVTKGGGVSVSTRTTLVDADPLPADVEVVGVIFDVTTTSDFESMELCFPYTDEQIVDEAIDEADLVIMHYTGGEWIEKQSDVYEDKNAACTSITSLSPFVLGGIRPAAPGYGARPIPALSGLALPLLASLLMLIGWYGVHRRNRG